MQSYTTPSLLSSYLLLLLSLLPFIVKAQDHRPLWTFCNSGYNYTQGTPYQSNLNLTLTSLASNITSNHGFYMTTTGTNYLSTVYGLLQCRGDISSQDCRTCADTSVLEITKRCPNQRQALIFYDKCMLHYANFRFFGTQQLFYLYDLPNKRNNSNPDLFNRQLVDLMTNLSSKAASDASKFSTGRSWFNEESVNIYGLVQCSRELSHNGCLGCLQDLIIYISACCNGRIGAQVLSMSCNLRYETHLFFQSSELEEDSSNIKDPVTLIDSQGHKNNSGNIILIQIIVVIAFAIGGCILLMKIMKRRIGGKEDGIKSMEYEIESSKSLKTVTQNSSGS